MSGGIGVLGFFGIGRGHSTPKETKPKHKEVNPKHKEAHKFLKVETKEGPQYLIARTASPQQVQEMNQAAENDVALREKMDQVKQDILDAKQEKDTAFENAAMARERGLKAQTEKQAAQAEKQAAQTERQAALQRFAELRKQDAVMIDECIEGFTEIETNFADMEGYEGFIQEAIILRLKVEGYKAENAQMKVVTQEIAQINESLEALVLKIQACLLATEN